MNARVSVAIPTRDRPESLRRTIRALLAGERLPDEIVVADQGEVPAELSIAPPPSVRLVRVRASGRGVSRNRNEAFAAASGEFVAFLDDDMEPDPGWLAAMLAEWERGWARGRVLITGPILGPEGSDPARVAGTRLLPGRTVWRGVPRTADVVYGGQFGAPAALYRELRPRPFDERLGPGTPFPAAEDTDFGWRVLAAGHPVVYVPGVRARHLTEKRPGPGRAWSYGVGFGGVAAKHVEAGWTPARRLLLRAAATSLAKAGRGALALRPREAVIRTVAVPGMLVGLVRWWARGGPAPGGTP